MSGVATVVVYTLSAAANYLSLRWRLCAGYIRYILYKFGSVDAPPKFITVPRSKYFYPLRDVGVVVARRGFFGFIVDNCVNSTPPPRPCHMPTPYGISVYITADGLCKNNPWVIYRVPLDKWLSLAARCIKRFL